MSRQQLARPLLSFLRPGVQNSLPPVPPPPSNALHDSVFERQCWPAWNTTVAVCFGGWVDCAWRYLEFLRVRVENSSQLRCESHSLIDHLINRCFFWLKFPAEWLLSLLTNFTVGSGGLVCWRCLFSGTFAWWSIDLVSMFDFAIFYEFWGY